MKTPQQSHPQLAMALGLKGELYLKREDLHPYGSHKGRSIPFMIKEYHKQEIRDFVISSSGNAALAAIHTVTQHNKNNPSDEIRLHIYIGHHISEEKKQLLSAVSRPPASASSTGEWRAGQPSAVTIEQVDNPKQTALQISKENKTTLLRQSTDDLALVGYEELALELNKIPNLSAIFIPTSSGTTAQGLALAFQKLSQKPQIHIVQTTACHPMAKIFDVERKGTQTKQSVAGAIVDQIAHRLKNIMAEIKKTNGSGWIVTDEEIQNAIILTKQTARVDISPNSALSIAGLQRAKIKNHSWVGAVICLITGE